MAKVVDKLVFELELDFGSRLEIQEACAEAGRLQALKDGNNELARHFSLRVSEIQFNRAWMREINQKERAAGPVEPAEIEA